VEGAHQVFSGGEKKGGDETSFLKNCGKRGGVEQGARKSAGKLGEVKNNKKS